MFKCRENQSLVLRNFRNVALNSCSRAHVDQVRNSPPKKYHIADMKIYEIFQERISNETLLLQIHCPPICNLHSTALHSTPLGFIRKFSEQFFLRATLNGCFCQEKTWKLPCFETYPCSWLKWMIINFFNIFMLKMSAAKFFLLRKQEKYAKFFHYGFSQFNTSSTSWKCLCTHFGHVTKIKTLLNIPLRIIEQNNGLPDRVFF